MIIDGRLLAAEIVAGLKDKLTPSDALAVIIVGEETDALSFIRQKKKVAQELRIDFRVAQFGGDITTIDLCQEIEKLSLAGDVGGIIVELPLPGTINRDAVFASIHGRKDIGTLAPYSVFTAPAVLTVESILAKYSFDLSDKVVAVVGRGLLIGRPIIHWLGNRCDRLITLHSQTGLDQLKSADLVITGVGKAGLIRPEMLKPGAGVIDFGYDAKDGKISGDLDTQSLTTNNEPLDFYTPTPGGTGPILVAELFRNFYRLVPSPQ
ncbi:MAG: bifunctional 5,10-methylenetetrahydrofolate dehydrogenase/5,10-methenyltetrahydrofolate cyclohydrolase [bacterium]|nr:bifunctional 5,10-methylenetetrahydrofolate dehydrogenase/5,10-methenyltetrahydrofolate cyclohydrolase [bacterium]